MTGPDSGPTPDSGTTEAGHPGWVFTGEDLLIGHYDQADVDWEGIAERTAVEELRGKVVVQATLLDGLLDELLMYLFDPAAPVVFEFEVLRNTPHNSES
jgi:hypothetical protein